MMFNNMRFNFQLVRTTSKVFCLALCLASTPAFAQQPEDVSVNNNDAFPDFTKLGGSTTPAPAASQSQQQQPTGNSGSGAASVTPSGSGQQPQYERVENLGDLPPDPDAPLDGIVERKTILEKQVLPYEPLRESDVMWSKTIWRVVDVREKINLPFVYPEERFIDILMNGIRDSVSGGGIRAYKAENDKFHYRLSVQEAMNIGSRVDTITTVDPITYETKYKVVASKFDPESVKRFRIKEFWYFDKQYSVLKVRILGIAPLRDVTDDAGNFLYEQPLFWVRYPDCREYFARHRVFVDGNDSNPMSWEDVFEMRRFSSSIFKESNVYGRRLPNYLTGVDILLEGEKIKQDIFNTEHDLWSY
jgi:gliding motility associated protien GldN